MTKCGFTNIVSQKFYAFSGIISQNFLSILLRMTFLNVPFLFFLLSIYIYKTKAFEAPTIFHVSIIFKLN